MSSSSRLHAQENGTSGGPVPDATRSDTRPRCVGTTRDGAPCGAFTRANDTFCYSHSPHVTDAERKAAWRLGGLMSTAHPDAADVPIERLQSRQEVARAREEVIALVRNRVLSAPVGSTILAGLRDADTARLRAAQLELDRQGRRPREHRLTVTIDPMFTKMLQEHQPPRAIPTTASVETPESPAPGHIPRRARRATP